MVKMESVSKNTISVVEMMVKSGLDFLKSLHEGNYLPNFIKGEIFCQNYKFINENYFLLA